jgi:cytochrome c peroxidase
VRPGKQRARHWLAAGCVVTLAIGVTAAVARPIVGKEGVLPPGTELNEDMLDQPTELFYSELAGGKRSYLLNLGDMLFSSPAILGGVARQAGMSCESCHQQGTNNAKLFVPGMSVRPGTFDTTNALFNPKNDNGVFDPVTPPSLRGAKFLAPYAHDGRFPTLRDFIRNAIVNEFAGPEPSDQVLDALEAYIKEIAFLPNDKLAAGGRLSAKASAAAHRGEALFDKPFRNDASMSCSSCHQPTAAFVDHETHDVGTGGAFKTPTLLNAGLNAPYFHDGRYDSFGEVVAYFDRHFDLGLTGAERSDLVAYLDAVGAADQPVTRDTVQIELDEIAQFASVLDTAVPEKNVEVITLTTDAIGNEWRELGENFPGRTDTSVGGGLAERLRAIGAAREQVLNLRRVAMAASAGDFDGATDALADYRKQTIVAAAAMKQAEPYSLFNPQVRVAHFRALQRLTEMAAATR